ncbi:MAG: hypothetical protein KJ067_16325 [Vicinamibacteria bacterium]|jgi:hypothetical protein|nr:hypothetical protein [Vicinamibacteria bacterium]
MRVVKRALLVGLFVLLYALHQDVWLWRSARPLVFGFLPPGLAWHAAYTIVVAGALWLLSTLAWPHALEREAEQVPLRHPEDEA